MSERPFIATAVVVHDSLSVMEGIPRHGLGEPGAAVGAAIGAAVWRRTRVHRVDRAAGVAAVVLHSEDLGVADQTSIRKWLECLEYVQRSSNGLFIDYYLL